MRMKCTYRLVLGACLSATCLLVPLRSVAEEPDAALERLNKAEVARTQNQLGWAVASVKYGASMISAAAVSADVEFPKTGTPPSAQRTALTRVLFDYKLKKQKEESNFIAFKGSAQFAVDAAALALTTVPAAGIFVPVFKATAQLGVDTYMNSYEGKMREELSFMLAGKRNQLQQIGGFTYEQLQGKEPDKIKEVLASNPNFVAEYRSMFPGDAAAQKMADEFVVESIRNVSMATLDQLAQQGKRIAAAEKNITALATNFKTFRDRSEKTFKLHADAIGELQGAVGGLQKAVSVLDARLQRTERDQSLIIDFVFDSMGPEQKASSLKAGLMAERFACPGGGIDCDQAKLKNELIDRFEAEAKVQKTLAKFTETVQSLGYVANIASNLGIDIPGLGEAVNIGNVAVQAFQSFSTGGPLGYLGAVSAVSGLFGKRPDPIQAQFAAMREYLGKEFAQVNAKLDLIIDNQRKLLDAVAALSKQMEAYYRATDERLQRLQFEVDRISEVVRQNAWKQFSTCNTVYQRAVIDSENSYHVQRNGDFTNLAHIFELLGNYGVEVDDCLKNVQGAVNGLRQTQFFGNFLDVRAAADDYRNVNVLPQPNNVENGYLRLSDLEAFLTSVYQPSLALIVDTTQTHKLPPERLYQLLAMPQPTLRFTAERLRTPSANSACGEAGYLDNSLKRLLCSANAGSANAAGDLLKRAMLVDHALDIGEWMLLVARLADLRGYRERYAAYDPATLIEYARNQGYGPSRGRDVTEDALLILAATTASYAVIYGDVTVRSVLDALTAPTEADPGKEQARKQRRELALGLLRSNNSYLRNNVALLLLHERAARNPDFAARHGLPSYSNYAEGLAFALGDTTDPGFWFRGLFGDDLVFTVDRERNEVLVTLATVMVDGKPFDIRGRLPGPEIFLSGRLTYPPRMMKLLSMRERVQDRLDDYDFFKNLTGELAGEDKVAMQAAIAGLLARAARTDPSVAK